jgi:hypothetical protein
LKTGPPSVAILLVYPSRESSVVLWTSSGTPLLLLLVHPRTLRSKQYPCSQMVRASTHMCYYPDIITKLLHSSIRTLAFWQNQLSLAILMPKIFAMLWFLVEQFRSTVIALWRCTSSRTSSGTAGHSVRYRCHLQLDDASLRITR